MSDILVKQQLSPLRGEIDIPSDKSISHRGIIIGSLTEGKIKIENFSKGKDCISTLNIFKNLGVDINFIDDKTLILNSKNGITKPSIPLDCGNSGTSMRLLAGYLAGQCFDSELFGDMSLSKRPMRRVIEPLAQMGANIVSESGHAPLKIFGKKLTGIEFSSKIASAQVKSSILLAGFHSDGITTVNEPSLSRNHTEIMLKYLDAEIKTYSLGGRFYSSIRKSKLTPKPLFISGDISSAAFFMAAGAIVKNSRIIIKNVGLNPTRTGIIDVMLQMGANIEILDKRTLNGEEVGDIKVSYSPDIKGVEISGSLIPRLIDEIPIICVLASFAEGKTTIKNAQDLKNKESDRIKCCAEGLLKMGADILPTEDGFIINGANSLKKLKGAAELETYCDHRLAMSFYVAALASEKPSLIKNFEWVNTSFPEFLQLFASLGI